MGKGSRVVVVAGKQGADDAVVDGYSDGGKW